MLTAAQFDALAVPITELYRELETSVILDMARRLAAMDMTSATAWQMQRLIESGATYREVIQKLSRLTGRSEAELRRTFSAAGVKSIRFDDRIYKAAGLSPLPLNLSPAMLNVLTAGLAKTGGEIRNLTMTTALDAENKFIRAADLAYLQVSTGAMSYDQAIRQAVKKFAADGLEVLYPSGHRDRLDVAMRRAVLTGVSQTTAQLQLTRMDEMGVDLVSVSAHIGARNTGEGPANHEAWQGQTYTRGANPDYPPFVETTGYGTVTGFAGVNCRHSAYPFFPGISPEIYNQTALEEMAAKSVTYNGREMSIYEATQRQREIERKIRYWKLQEAAAGIVGDSTPERLKVAAWQAEMRDFIRQMNDPATNPGAKDYEWYRQRVREQI
jgi:hypothetical protein